MLTIAYYDQVCNPQSRLYELARDITLSIIAEKYLRELPWQPRPVTNLFTPQVVTQLDYTETTADGTYYMTGQCSMVPSTYPTNIQLVRGHYITVAPWLAVHHRQQRLAVLKVHDWKYTQYIQWYDLATGSIQWEIDICSSINFEHIFMDETQDILYLCAQDKVYMVCVADNVYVPTFVCTYEYKFTRLMVNRYGVLQGIR